MAIKTGKCPRCEAKFPNTKIGRIQLLSHWAKLQKQGEPAHISDSKVD
jgi:hypothetical protein